MSVTVNFKCSGCFTETKGTTFLRRRFISTDGKAHGVGRYVIDTPQDVAPEGWIAFDPYTGCCYCPDCWKEFENGTK